MDALPSLHTDVRPYSRMLYILTHGRTPLLTNPIYLWMLYILTEYTRTYTSIIMDALHPYKRTHTSIIMDALHPYKRTHKSCILTDVLHPYTRTLTDFTLHKDKQILRTDDF